MHTLKYIYKQTIQSQFLMQKISIDIKKKIESQTMMFPAVPAFMSRSALL